jgi:membrane protein implicated in regulation of membrane protease activity
MKKGMDNKIKELEELDISITVTSIFWISVYGIIATVTAFLTWGLWIALCVLLIQVSVIVALFFRMIISGLDSKVEMKKVLIERVKSNIVKLEALKQYRKGLPIK